MTYFSILSRRILQTNLKTMYPGISDSTYNSDKLGNMGLWAVPYILMYRLVLVPLPTRTNNIIFPGITLNSHRFHTTF